MHTETGSRCVLDVDYLETGATLKVKLCRALFEGETPRRLHLLGCDGAAVDDTSDISQCNVSCGDELSCATYVTHEDRTHAAALIASYDIAYCEGHGTDPSSADLLQQALSFDPQSIQASARTTLIQKRATRDEASSLLDTIVEHPGIGSLYLWLAATMWDGRPILLRSGVSMTSVELLKMAISVEPTLCLGYVELAGKMIDEGRVRTTLGGSHMWTVRALLTHAIALDAQCGAAYWSLSLIDSDEVTIFEDGTTMTREQVIKRVITFFPERSEAYSSLAAIMASAGNDTTILEDGRVVTQRELCKRAVGLSPLDTAGYRRLGLLLEPGETVTLEDNTVVTKEWLLDSSSDEW